FPDEYSPSSVVLVFTRAESDLTPDDLDFIDGEVKQRIIRNAPPEDVNPIVNLLSPKMEHIGALLVSPDKRSALLLAPLKTPFQDRHNIGVIDKIEEVVNQVREEKLIPHGLQVAIAGSAVAGRDLDREQGSSVHAIEGWTIVIVIVLLLLLYRAPVAAL